MGYQSLILKVVEDTWVRRLRDPDSFYARISPRDILDLLAMHSGELERADIVSMFVAIHLWRAEDPHVPKFFNRSNNAQKKATFTSLPIMDDWLVAMSTSTLLSENSFTNNGPSWDGLFPSAQSWTACKLKFLPLHSAIERGL